jgi:hypothetical protein
MFYAIISLTDPMRRVCIILLSLFAATAAGAQQPSNDESAPLVLVRIIPLPDVQGRFDHMGVDNKSGRVFVAVYGDDSVQVLEIPRAKQVRSIKQDFRKPQMALYLADSNRLVVSNEGDGSCKVFDADTYKLLDTVKFPEDADQLRYDSARKRVYVGYGDGAIGAFDAATNKRVDTDFELGAHPESFQL